jgi:N-acetylmuramic acid 6-phosphate etherase
LDRGSDGNLINGIDHLPPVCVHWPTMTAFDQLDTEARDAAGADLDLHSTAELVKRMNAGDAVVPPAVAGATRAIAELIDAVADRLAHGGRLIYVGAGTSGRLAALDAVECETTFSTPPGQVAALVAGGASLSAAVQEAAEDDAAAGASELEALGVSPADAVVGVSASGCSPYVRGALETARMREALTGCIVCVDGSELAELAELVVCVPVGAEFLAGSTRLKAGTAQKLVLNMLSTISMIRLGKTYGNLMVDVDATNDKLRARVRSIVRHATGEPPERIDEALAAAGGDVKVAIVSLLAGVDAEAARARLAAADGVVRQAVEETA